MYSIDDITDYVISSVKSEDKTASLIHLKLQKLLYYIQAWSYGINKSPFFEGDFEAWIHGPVNRHIYNRFSLTKTLYSEINLEDRIKDNIAIKEKDKEFLDFILENYVKFSGAELEKMTHSEQPWIKARGSLGMFERCDTIISPDDMKDYYGKKWAEINNK